MNDQKLSHHGVLGMKWGVRRYQNYDGSYTQRGLRRYNQSKEAYDAAKDKVKSTKERHRLGGASKSEVKSAKSELKAAKRTLDKSYDRLKNDKRADQGKALYQKGKTITSNSTKIMFRQSAVVAGSGVIGKVLSDMGDSPYNKIAPGVLAAGGTAVNAMLYAKNEYENKRLRAYYGH